MIAVSLMSSILNKEKNAVIQSHFSMNNLTKALLGTNMEDTFLETGIDALMRDVKTAPITKEVAASDSIAVLNGLYNIFGETAKKNKSPYEQEVMSYFNKIINALNKHYEHIYIDVASGYGEESKNILNNADIVVVNLCQNKSVIEEYLRHPLEHENVIYLFGNYNYHSKYNVKNLRRMYPLLKKSICANIRYSYGFLDALNDGRVIEFMFKNQDIDRVSENYNFMQSVKEVVAIIEKKGEQLLENS